MSRERTMVRSKEFVRLLCEVAPELALRGILRDCSDSSPSPELYRAIISTLLRASSVGIADSVYEVLCAASGAPAHARLGWTHLTSPATARSILQDIISSAVREEPLNPENAALRFYNNAGVGSSDPEEYSHPPHEGLSVVFGEGAMTLAETRSRSLRLVLRYIAEVARDNVAGAIRIGDCRMWTSLVDDLRVCVGRINPDTLCAAQELLGAVLAVEGEQERQDIVNRLVTAFQDLAAKEPESLTPFISTLRDANVKFRACLTYLRQRFGAGGVGNCDAKSLKVSRFVSDFLEIEVVSGRNNAVLPVVITGLVQAWLEVAESECFKVSDNVTKVAKLVGRLSVHKKKLIEKCKPNMNDETEFFLVMLAVATRVLVANGAGRM